LFLQVIFPLGEKAMQKQKLKLNNKGQSLVEYLIIVALVAIGTMGVVRVLGFNLSANFTRVSNALSNTKTTVETKNADAYHKMKDFGNFMEGATDGDQKK
jgi:Flp pilus assembly pilin Flp